MSSIVCSNLSFAWPDDTPAVRRICPSPSATGRTGLVAPNGAGKSTLLQADRRRIPAHRRHRSPSTAPSATCRRRCRSSRDLNVADVLGVAAGHRRAQRAGGRRRRRRGLHRDRRRLGHRGAHPRPARPARPGPHRLRPAAGLAVRRRGGLPRAGRAAAEAARRAAARRADQQPRRRRAPPALRRARRLHRLPAAGQPRPCPARSDGPHRRAAIAAKSCSTEAISRMYEQTVQACATGRGGKTCATPSSS